MTDATPELPLPTEGSSNPTEEVSQPTAAFGATTSEPPTATPPAPSVEAPALTENVSRDVSMADGSVEQA